MLKIPDVVTRQFFHHMMKSPDDETGGLLFGRVHDGVVQLHWASGPGPWALRGPTEYTPDLNYLLGYLEAYHAMLPRHQSHDSYAVGDWHSHPSDVFFAPSPEDIEALKKAAAQKDDHVMLITVMNEDFEIDAAAYQWKDGLLRLPVTFID
jgi:hypothetical protein